MSVTLISWELPKFLDTLLLLPFVDVSSSLIWRTLKAQPLFTDNRSLLYLPMTLTFLALSSSYSLMLFPDQPFQIGPASRSTLTMPLRTFTSKFLLRRNHSVSLAAFILYQFENIKVNDFFKLFS